MRASGNPLFVQALAAEIKARRNEAGLTQEDLAGASELDRPYITLMEAGKKQPTVSVLWRIGQGLNIPASELLIGAERRYAALKAPPTPIEEPNSKLALE